MLEKQKIRKAALLVMKKILLLTTGGTIASSDTGSGLIDRKSTRLNSSH